MRRFVLASLLRWRVAKLKFQCPSSSARHPRLTSGRSRRRDENSKLETRETLASSREEFRLVVKPRRSTSVFLEWRNGVARSGVRATEERVKESARGENSQR